MKMVKIPYWMAEAIRDFCSDNFCYNCMFDGKCSDPEEYPCEWKLDEICEEEDEDDG